jgi:aminoglycoside phosphotransferase (APT) family kinase protein
MAMLEWPRMGTITTDHCSVVRRFDGGFNHIVEMAVIAGSHTENYIVRVPAIGNAHNMRCEVALMKYLSKKTKVPVPEVVCFETKLDSRVGAQYILMEQLLGEPAYVSWFEKCKERNHLSGNRVPPDTEMMRCNILRSLANTMVDLQNIEFDKIGMPDFTATLDHGEKPVITHSYQWVEDTAKNNDQLIPYGPFDSSEEFMASKIEEKWSSLPDSDVEDDIRTQNMLLGVRKILNIIYANTIISCSVKPHQNSWDEETFVLRHPDLDLQNILVDDAGNVTGIIDWEGCFVVPRCAGYSCLPEFLRRDWTSSFSLSDSPHMTFLLNHYRRIYADAMLATGCPEAKYTRKSAMYRAIVDAINNDVIAAVQRLISSPRWWRRCRTSIRGMWMSWRRVLGRDGTRRMSI